MCIYRFAGYCQIPLLKDLFCAYFRDVWFCKVAAINDHIIVQSVGFSLEAYTFVRQQAGYLQETVLGEMLWLLEKIYEEFQCL